VTQRGSMMTSTRGEVIPGMGKGGDGYSWTDTNFIGPKNEENSCDRFSWYKRTVEI
jgi:hypothetical protein